MAIRVSVPGLHATFFRLQCLTNNHKINSMPNTSSAKKALKQSITRRARNLTAKQRLKKTLKSVTADTHAQATSNVDKAVKQGLIHKNKAARVKSRLDKKLGVAKEKRPGAGKATPKKASK